MISESELLSLKACDKIYYKFNDELVLCSVISNYSCFYKVLSSNVHYFILGVISFNDDNFSRLIRFTYYAYSPFDACVHHNIDILSRFQPYN